jgi:hypothetical protein
VSRLDDLLREGLARLAEGPVGTDPLRRIAARRRWRAARRRAGTALLGVAVVGGTVFGVSGLRRVFPVAGGSQGAVAFVRLLRPCGPYADVGGGLEVFAADLATGEERLVSGAVSFRSGSSIPSERWPAFGPDGSFYVWVDHYRGALYRTEVPSGETLRIAEVTGLGGAGTSLERLRLSPDGRLVLFAVPTSVEETTAPDGTIVGRETSEIYVVPATGGTPRRLAQGELPVWMPDGRIAFMRTDVRVTFRETPEGMRKEETPLPTRFYVMEADGTGIREVYRAPGDIRIVDADWSPDGSKVVGEVTRGRDSDLYLLDLEARTVVRLTDDPANDTSPAWSPDGSMIAFRTGRWGSGPGHSEIAVMRADGSGLRRITHDCWDDHDPAWVPDPSALAALPVWTPEEAPAPEEGPGRDVGLPLGLCHVEQLRGIDLLGDGASGTAWTGAPVGEDGSCPEGFEGTIVAADVTGDGLADAWWGPLEHCVLCEPYDAADLDADGDEELVVLAQAASTPQFLLFSARPGPELAPITVAAPGHHPAGLPPGEPLSIRTGGDEGFRGAVACEGSPGDPILVVAWANHPVEGPGSETTEVHVTRLALRDDVARVVEASDTTQPTADPLPFPFGSTGRACGVDLDPLA